MDEWDAALREASRLRLRQPSGPGWLTRAQLTQKWGVTWAVTGNRLKLLSEEGRCERFRGTDLNEAGVIVRQDWYRLKK